MAIPMAIPSNYVSGWLVLKTGQSIPIKTNPERKYDAVDLTEKTILSFIGANGSSYLVQGNNIAYIQVEGINA